MPGLKLAAILCNLRGANPIAPSDRFATRFYELLRASHESVRFQMAAAENIEIRSIETGDPVLLQRSFSGTPWDRGVGFFAGLVAEAQDGRKAVLVGLMGGRIVAFVSILWESEYGPFATDGTPEIHDLNVHPEYRRRGVASALLDRAEEIAFARNATVGIGVGLHPGYRAAQRLYVLRGYAPDGRGLYYRGRFPEEGETVTLDDDLIMYLTKPAAPSVR